MIDEITQAANAVGINAIVSDSNTKLATQLNTLTRDADAPILLISWDINTTAEFDTNGFLKAPKSKIVFMLFEKPEMLTNRDYKDTSENMQELFMEFIQALYPLLTNFKRSIEDKNISDISVKLIPVQKPSHHSGCNGEFTMIVGAKRKC